MSTDGDQLNHLALQDSENTSEGPISRVPDDILLEIFYAYQNSPYDDSDPDWTPNMGWIRSSTHVCRRWRYLAIASPLLWTYIVAETPRIDAMFLERSGALPVDVSADFVKNGATEAMMESIMVCSQRIQSLKICIPAIPLAFLALSRLFSFPQLTELSIDKDDDNVMVPLPRFLSSLDHLPRLQHLRLLGFHPRVTGPLMHRGLRTLQLFPTWNGTFEEFLGILSVLSGGSLEELTLGQDIPDAIADYAEEFYAEVNNRNSPVHFPAFAHSISLPHLKKLYIDSATANCMVIIRHLVNPRIETLTLKLAPEHVGSYEVNDDRVSQLLPLAFDCAGKAVTVCPTSGSTADIVSLNIAWGNAYEEALSILAWTTSIPLFQFFLTLQIDPDPNEPTSLLPLHALHVFLESYTAGNILVSLCSGLNLRNLKMLSLTEISSSGEGQELDAERLSTLLRHVPSVETLSISIAIATDLPRLLSLSAAHPDGPILPLLKVLNIGLSALDYYNEEDKNPPSLVRLPALIDHLHARVLGGSGLDMLRIPHYFLGDLRPARAEKLRRCATTVHLSRYPDADVIWKATDRA